jgi:hypothetical protein
MRDYMWLSIWWSDVSSDYGMTKGNRAGEQSHWTAEELYDAASLALFARMATADGIEQTTARKINIDTTIVALKAASLWDTVFDRLIVYRATGNGSRMLNWISTSFNAAAVANGGALSQHDDIGVHSDGTNSYIRSNYIPSSDGVLFKKDDACFGLKVSGTMITVAVAAGHGANGGSSNVTALVNLGVAAAYQRLNAIDYGSTIEVYTPGYNNLSRSISTEVKMHRTNPAGENTFIANSVGLPTVEMYTCAQNSTGTPIIFTPATEIVEIEWEGKALTYANFQIFVTIMDAYIAGL